MEFLELLESAQEFIPAQYANVSLFLDTVLPYLFMVMSLLICLFGYKLHKLWLAFIFFSAGFFAGALSGMLFAPNLNIYLFIGLGLVLGVAAAHFSHKIYRLQLFVMTALLVYGALPTVLDFLMPPAYSNGASLIAALACGLLTMRYKYLVTIVTTAVSGAVSGVGSLLAMLAVDTQQKPFFALLLMLAAGVLGVAVQFAMEAKKPHPKPPEQPTEEPAPPTQPPVEQSQA